MMVNSQVNECRRSTVDLPRHRLVEYQEVEGEMWKESNGSSEYVNGSQYHSNGSHHNGLPTNHGAMASMDIDKDLESLTSGASIQDESPTGLSVISRFHTAGHVHAAFQSDPESLPEHNGSVHIDAPALLVRDLYGQRHIAYFDPSSNYEQVESIDPFENEEFAVPNDVDYQRAKSVSHCILGT